MFVNQLPLVVVFRMRPAISPCQRLGGFISLETQVELLLMLRLVRLP